MTDTDAALVERLAQAGVPRSVRQVDIGSLIVQGKSEDWSSFASRVQEDGQWGLGRHNLAAVDLLRRWDPPSLPGLGDWLVLHGPPGGGKSALLGALARKLLTVRGMQSIPIPRAELVALYGEERLEWLRLIRRDVRVRPASYRVVRYVLLPELVRAEERSRNYAASQVEDHDLMPRCKRVQVLVLDELGADPNPTDRELRLVEELLDYRADERLLTLVATNRTPQELTGPKSPLYGARVADRLAAAQWVHIAGPSWRTAA